jgi:hypothetical protein
MQLLRKRCDVCIRVHRPTTKGPDGCKCLGIQVCDSRLPATRASPLTRHVPSVRAPGRRTLTGSFPDLMSHEIYLASALFATLKTAPHRNHFSEVGARNTQAHPDGSS